MLAFGPPDLDPTIRTYPDLDLISRVKIGSGGSGRLGARSGGAARRSRAPRRSFAGGSKLGAAGLGLGRGLAEGGVCRVRKAPGLTAGLGEVLLGLATAWGGASSPASGVLSPGVS